MKLSYDKIKEIATGAVRFSEENGALRLCRFTGEQASLYKETNPDFYNKSFATAGVKLLFKTDSKNLFIKTTTSYGSSREYFSFDVFVNGEIVGYLDNFSNENLPEDYTHIELGYGEFSKSFNLGEGVKEVCVHFPWSVCAAIEEISLDDGALLEAVKPKKKLLAYGDSITHGYDALRPSNRYIAKLAESLGAEEFNKAIGGEKFFPSLAKLPDSFVPDYITVAYGTNDWSLIDEETFKYNCKAFYENLSKNYPDSKIFAITPIWRKDINEEKPIGAFENVEKHIRNAVENLKNVTVISGIDLTPSDEKYFADLRLHPTDKGFEYYHKNLYNKIKSEI